MRINLFLARMTRLSRRKAEVLIQEGRVKVNGTVIQDLSTQIQPWLDRVELDGNLLQWEEEEPRILAFHKPSGYLTSHSDRFHTQTIFHLLPPEYMTYKFIGRLDLRSRGLLLLTNSGMYLHQISHPSSHIEKEYFVQINEKAPFEKIRNSFTLGLWEGGEFLQAKKVLSSSKNSHQFQIVLESGKKRQIRRMFSALGYEVLDLVRTRIGNLRLEDLRIQEGEWKQVALEQILPLEKLETKP